MKITIDEDNLDRLLDAARDILPLARIAIIHAQEYLGRGGHPLDKGAFDAAVNDPVVKAWLDEGVGMAMLPLRRDDGKAKGGAK
jgi:hypothetical protein